MDNSPEIDEAERLQREAEARNEEAERALAAGDIGRALAHDREASDLIAESAELHARVLADRRRDLDES